MTRRSDHGFGDQPPALFRRSPALSRRSLLGGIAGTAGLAGLAGCGTDSDDDTGAPPAGPAKTPAYVPYAEVTPDKEGTAEGVAPVFYNFPDNPVDREGFPLPEGGEPFSALMQALPPDVPPDQNKNYANLYEKFGCTFDIIYGTYVDYTEKFQVTMAGNDIPDLCMFIEVAQLPALLEKNFTDLTDVLGGDAIKDYPGLANIPTPTWKIGTVNGRIYGIAQPRPPAGNVITSRGDILAERGIDDPNLELRDGDDFLEMMKQLTNEDKNEFAMGADPLSWLMHCAKTMAGVPNTWSDNGGTFVHENESEEMIEALNIAAKIWQAGYLHPNSFSDIASNASWLEAGVTALYVQSFTGWGAHARNHPDWNVGNIEMPKWEGGGLAPIRKSAAGYYSAVAFKKTDDDKRLEQLLRIADYIASPFGTQQYLDVIYGVEGYSYEMENGNPVYIPDSPPIPTLTYTGSNSGAVLYGQGVTESVDAQHEYLSRVIPTGIDDPTLGLYSETKVSKAATLANEQKDVMREVIQGTKPMTAWTDFVKSWKSKVGDAMAAEYAEAAAAAE